MNQEPQSSNKKNNAIIAGIIVAASIFNIGTTALIVGLASGESSSTSNSSVRSDLRSDYESARQERSFAQDDIDEEGNIGDESKDENDGDEDDGDSVVVEEKDEPKNQESSKSSQPAKAEPKTYRVISVVDGDTIHIDYNGKDEKVRFIGIDTPEVSDYGGKAECYGAEASSYMKTILNGQWVAVETDSKTNDRDKYGRLLRYVLLDGRDLGHEMVSKGYAKEYTYDVAYDKQAQYRSAQSEAKNNKAGMWGVCLESNSSTQQEKSAQSTTPTVTEEQKTPVATQAQPAQNTPSTNHVYGENGDCNIKGNINRKEKIYHVPGSRSYKSTIINESEGERWFCSEAEAQAAGWRAPKR